MLTLLDDVRGKTLNELQGETGKRWDLGWVYTVIAGVLNILVIYDAFAGPTYLNDQRSAVHVNNQTAHLNYTNRVAEGLGVEPEP